MKRSLSYYLKNSKVLIFCSLLMAGCGDQTLYYWDNYDDIVYEYYTDGQPTEAIEKMEMIRLAAQEQSKPLPPTFYAHLSLLYQQVGEGEKFQSLIKEETKAHPEMTGYSEFLLKGVR